MVKGKTRIFFTSDIHGSEYCFKKFLNAAKFYNADVLILGGDIAGKMIVPVLKFDDGTFRARVMGRERTAKGEDEQNKLLGFIHSMGFYPYVVTPREMEELKDPEKLDALFREVVTETVKRWMKLACERLKGSRIKCFIQPGNDDPPEIAEILSQCDCVVNPEDKVLYIDGSHEMISLGYANLTPWKCPRDLSEEMLEEKIERMAAKVNKMSSCLFNFHCPPYNTELDLAPELDENLTVVMKAGKPNIIHVGSIAVRKSIEKHQPLLGLHGHIHESRGVYRLGKTVCFNPGSEYTEGILRGVIIQLKENGGLAGYQLTSG
ncbi:MAG: metallophosphoesterase family protein [Candidatus Bathycorpusculaceae bacterium]